MTKDDHKGESGLSRVIKTRLQELTGAASDATVTKVAELFESSTTASGLADDLVEVVGQEHSHELADYLLSESKRTQGEDEIIAENDGIVDEESLLKGHKWQVPEERAPITSRVGPPVNEEQRRLEEEEEANMYQWGEGFKRQRLIPQDVNYGWMYGPYYGTPAVYSSGGQYPHLYHEPIASHHPRPKASFRHRTWVRDEGSATGDAKKGIESALPSQRPQSARSLAHSRNKTWVNPTILAKEKEAADALSSSLPPTPPPEE